DTCAISVNRRLNLSGITGCGGLRFESADIDATVHHARKTRSALIVVRRRSKVRIAGIDGRAARQQCVGEGPTAIVLQWPKYRIGIDLVIYSGQKAAPVIVAQVVAKRGHRAEVIINVLA